MTILIIECLFVQERDNRLEKGGKMIVKKAFILFLMETYPTVSSNLCGFTHLQLESAFVAGMLGIVVIVVLTKDVLGNV